MTVVRRSRAAAVLAITAGVVAGLTACSSGSEPYRPTGVDGLTIPTPTPDPEDFVAGSENRWLPLEPGMEWEYRVTTDRGTRTVRTTVEDRTEDVAGVAATVVLETVLDQDDGVVEENYTWYAEDTAGNVWRLGESFTRYRHHAVGGFEWRAGEEGAEAALAMPAEPRTGDGYSAAYEPGERELVARVLATDEAVSVPAGDYDDVVVLEVRDDGRSSADVRREYYAPGVGLVRVDSGDGAETGLVAYHEPRS